MPQNLKNDSILNNNVLKLQKIVAVESDHKKLKIKRLGRKNWIYSLMKW